MSEGYYAAKHLVPVFDVCPTDVTIVSLDLDLHEPVDYIAMLNRRARLERLTISPLAYRKLELIQFSQPLFHNLTHLEFLESYHASLGAHIGHSLALALNNTHLAFTLPELVHARGIPDYSTGNRFLMVEEKETYRNFFRGGAGRRDYWQFADEFLAAKRAGKIDHSSHLIAPPPRFPALCERLRGSRVRSANLKFHAGIIYILAHYPAHLHPTPGPKSDPTTSRVPW
ncbi:hypothetical protein FB45DRAFT_872389 [Roridomyces roridus]|uniref:Uncharacterized protein n=1 Tax=Roridomyces roridus TaxID=1738132 RepID=A0AAD7FGV7_9AGAR|nr:hypothetical protein FB45DRAFT_872389 [Roridomyces roridus]